jgi:ribosome-binding protein aMBF1 (putative translation factor)
MPPVVIAGSMKVTRETSLAFAKVVKKHRQARGISLARLAELTSTDQTYPGKLERGILCPSLDIASAFAKALGVPLSRLLAEAEKFQEQSSDLKRTK